MGSHLPLLHRIPPCLPPLQEEKLLLFPRWQVQKVHDLGDSSTTHATKAGQIRIIPDDPLADQAVKMNGERHEPGNPGSRIGSLRLWGLRFPSSELLPTRFGPFEVDRGDLSEIPTESQ